GHSANIHADSPSESRRCWGTGGPVNQTGLSRSESEADACYNAIGNATSYMCFGSPPPECWSFATIKPVACDWIHPGPGTSPIGPYPVCTCINGSVCPGSTGWMDDL